MSESAYEQGFFDDGEPETIDDLSTGELDRLAQEQYGLSSWTDVEAQWVQEDAEQEAQLQAEHEAALAGAYASQRLGQLTRSAVEETGAGDIHLPALHDVAAGLAADAEWRRDHPGLEGEQAVAAAIKEGVTVLSPAEDEFEALRRRELRLRARGLTVRGEPDDGTR